METRYHEKKQGAMIIRGRRGAGKNLGGRTLRQIIASCLSALVRVFTVDAFPHAVRDKSVRRVTGMP